MVRRRSRPQTGAPANAQRSVLSADLASGRATSRSATGSDGSDSSTRAQTGRMGDRPRGEDAVAQAAQAAQRRVLQQQRRRLPGGRGDHQLLAVALDLLLELRHGLRRIDDTKLRSDEA